MKKSPLFEPRCACTGWKEWAEHPSPETEQLPTDWKRLASFQQLVYAGLLKKKGVKRLQPSCVPAMGPDYRASCLAYFAPNTTTFATLEFTPNMGEGRELESNGAHLTQMAMQLLQRGVRVVLVSLVPRPPACNKPTYAPQVCKKTRSQL